jgi:predicted Zn-dependent protease
MPKPIKKKTRKKTRLDEEGVKSRALETVQLLKEKRKILIYTLSAIVVVVILAVALIVYSSSVRKKAFSYELDAYNYYYNVNLRETLTDEQRMKKSLELFEKSSDIKSTPAVQFYIGNCYFNLGDYNNAIEAYLEFIDRHSGEKEMLPLVYQKLVSAYMKVGEKDELLKTLADLEQFENGMFRDTALILQARFFETQKNQEEAEKKYRELVKTFPLSPWSVDAKTKIKVEEGKEKDAGMLKEPTPKDKERVKPANAETLPPED